MGATMGSGRAAADNTSMHLLRAGRQAADVDAAGGTRRFCVEHGVSRLHLPRPGPVMRQRACTHGATWSHVSGGRPIGVRTPDVLKLILYWDESKCVNTLQPLGTCMQVLVQSRFKDSCDAVASPARPVGGTIQAVTSRQKSWQSLWWATSSWTKFVAACQVCATPDPFLFSGTNNRFGHNVASVRRMGGD